MALPQVRVVIFLLFSKSNWFRGNYRERQWSWHISEPLRGRAARRNDYHASAVVANNNDVERFYIVLHSFTAKGH